MPVNIPSADQWPTIDEELIEILQAFVGPLRYVRGKTSEEYAEHGGKQEIIDKLRQVYTAQKTAALTSLKGQ